MITFMAEFMKTVLRLCTKLALKSLQVMKKKKRREREIDMPFHSCIVYFGEEKNTLDTFRPAFLNPYIFT